ncbi:hypothetical protein CNMCM7691_004057 [Aspergillus felis]|uniref:Uncharacterized protein n=1 Tax=Aspergillus felis TaxID=1287682 RepID=A0A8H6R4I5_9EURO|nr:hypothetical protein CNMCM7691_004057 [Aspergillus felis]
MHCTKSSILRKVRGVFSRLLAMLPDRVREEALSFDSPYIINAALAMLIGGLLGLTPPLHRAFFEPYEEGGIFNAWLVSSVKNIGKLFITLQLFTVGSKLGVSFEKMRRGEGTGRMPWRAHEHSAGILDGQPDESARRRSNTLVHNDADAYWATLARHFGARGTCTRLKRLKDSL